MKNVVCSQCSHLKLDTDFYKNIKGNVILPCKLCIKERNKKYYQSNKSDISQRKRLHYKKNKSDVLEKVKAYQKDNEEKISAQKNIYYKNNREEKLRKQVKYRAKSLRNFYARHKNDPEYKIRKRLSFSIARELKKNNSGKYGKSYLKYLPYSIQELKAHLEAQFEPWMTWDNWGNYCKETWLDGDISTWTWQIDHVVPHSTFKYSSMEDQSFKDCWALKNLRPLSAKQNNSDGVNRIRHHFNKRLYYDS